MEIKKPSQFKFQTHWHVHKVLLVGRCRYPFTLISRLAGKSFCLRDRGRLGNCGFSIFVKIFSQIPEVDYADWFKMESCSPIEVAMSSIFDQMFGALQQLPAHRISHLHMAKYLSFYNYW